MPVAPKRVRIQSSRQYRFTLLGSTVAKATRRNWHLISARLDLTQVVQLIFSSSTALSKYFLLQMMNLLFSEDYIYKIQLLHNVKGDIQIICVKFWSIFGQPPKPVCVNVSYFLATPHPPP